ncbi:protecting protein DprA protein [Sesbania bispinosa]|nr:protecting protein DprA protein [Sesbania bispinosa]
MRLLSPRRLSSSAHRPAPSPTVSVPFPPSLSVLLPVPPSFACAWLLEEGFRLPLLRHHLPPLAVTHTPTFCTGKLSHLLQEVVLDATTTGSQYVNSILR